MLCTSLTLFTVNTGLTVARNLGILRCYRVDVALMEVRVYVLKNLHFF